MQLIPDAQQMQQRISQLGHVRPHGLCSADFYPAVGRHPDRDRADAAAVSCAGRRARRRSGTQQGRLRAARRRRERSLPPASSRSSACLHVWPNSSATGGVDGDRARAAARTLARSRPRSRALGLPIHFVDEYETSRAARELYFAEHPPRGWRRLVPIGLQLPPRPIDDYAAILIARRFLARGAARSTSKLESPAKSVRSGIAAARG